MPPRRRTDFAQAAVGRVKLSDKMGLGADPLLRLNYIGDMAGVSINGKLLTDDFYNGNSFEVGLRRYAPDVLAGDLRVAVLPLRKNAPIYLDRQAKPDFGSTTSVAALRGMEIVPRYTVQLTAKSQFTAR